MKYVNQLTDKQVNQLHALYQNEWWSKGRTLKDTKKCVENSQFIFGLLDENENLIGFSRILTDQVYKALIFDVIVSDSYRGKGLGQSLIAEIKNHKILRDVQHFELYCLPEMIPFYEKHGFNSDLGEVKLMRYANL